MKCKNTYIYNLLFFLTVILIKKKNTDLSFSLVKKLKSYATIAPLSIFSLGKGRQTLMPQTLFKNFKKCKVHFQTKNPYNALV